MPATTTLRQLLTQPKPEIPRTLKGGKNSTNRQWPSLDNDSITLWQEFNITTLNESYGHILDLAIPEAAVAVPNPTHDLGSTQVKVPRDIQHLVGWNAKVIKPTLEHARNHLQLHKGLALVQKKTSPTLGQEMARIPSPPGSRFSTIKVDHYVAIDNFPMAYLVIGLGRPSHKFPARKVAEGNATDEMIWPLSQLGYHCSTVNTRYGYIQTDEDLLVCCFNKDREDEWSVAIKPIPWTRHGENQLTSDLALWWLTMLAMSCPQRRALVSRDIMVKIDEWEYEHYDDERGWVRRHKYSKHEEGTEPPAAPPYQTPSPDNLAGNLAMFHAQVGLHADPDFELGLGSPFQIEMPAAEQQEMLDNAIWDVENLAMVNFDPVAEDAAAGNPGQAH